mmetsp:Transcript_29628/g.89724  ORF Transcript_29628/g.89724 Transcript_29628/m.89724 type:complete len:408 (-) Transcript_29628:1215-2438(-)
MAPRAEPRAAARLGAGLAAAPDVPQHAPGPRRRADGVRAVGPREHVVCQHRRIAVRLWFVHRLPRSADLRLVRGRAAARRRAHRHAVAGLEGRPARPVGRRAVPRVVRRRRVAAGRRPEPGVPGGVFQNDPLGLLCVRPRLAGRLPLPGGLLGHLLGAPSGVRFHDWCGYHHRPEPIEVFLGVPFAALELGNQHHHRHAERHSLAEASADASGFDVAGLPLGDQEVGSEGRAVQVPLAVGPARRVRRGHPLGLAGPLAPGAAPRRIRRPYPRRAAPGQRPEIGLPVEGCQQGHEHRCVGCAYQLHGVDRHRPGPRGAARIQRGPVAGVVRLRPDQRVLLVVLRLRRHRELLEDRGGQQLGGPDAARRRGRQRLHHAGVALRGPGLLLPPNVRPRRHCHQVSVQLGPI